MDTRLDRSRLVGWTLTAIAAGVIVWLAMSDRSGRAPENAVSMQSETNETQHDEAPLLIGTGDRSSNPIVETEVVESGVIETAVTKLPANPPTDTSPRVKVRFVGSGVKPWNILVSLVADDDVNNKFWLRIRRYAKVALPVTAKRYEVHAMTLDGRVSDNHSKEAKRIGPGLFEIVVRVVDKTVLSVTDERGNARADAYAYCMSGSDEYCREFPTPSAASLEGKRRAADESGSIKLPRTNRPTSWWVRAPDCAWARVEASPDVEVIDVSLKVGGGLNVEVICPKALPPYAIRIARVMDGVESEMLNDKRAKMLRSGELVKVDNDHFRVSGLRPGTWQVLVGRDSDLFISEVWAQQDVEVHAGQAVDASINIPPQDSDSMHDVRGELIVPSAWGRRPSRIRMEGALDDNDWIDRECLLDTREQGSHWPIEWQDVPRGLYMITVYPFGQSWYVRVPDDIAGLRLEVPPPVSMEVHVVDSDTRKPIPKAEVWVSYSVERPEEVTSWGSEGNEANRERPTGIFRGTFRAGPVEISASAPGYVEKEISDSLDASATPYRRTFRLRKGATLLVRIMKQGTLVKTARGTVIWSKERHSLSTNTEPWSWSKDLKGGSVEIADIAEGTYSVGFSTGFVHPKSTQSVTLRAGERHVVDIELNDE